MRREHHPPVAAHGPQIIRQKDAQTDAPRERLARDFHRVLDQIFHRDGDALAVSLSTGEVSIAGQGDTGLDLNVKTSNKLFAPRLGLGIPRGDDVEVRHRAPQQRIAQPTAHHPGGRGQRREGRGQRPGVEALAHPSCTRATRGLTAHVTSYEMVPRTRAISSAVMRSVP